MGRLTCMRKSGRIAGLALKKSLQAVRAGITPLEIDKIAEEEIYRSGGDLSYKTVPGYRHATCITVNEQVVHGIPTDRVIQAGDLVSIDLAVNFRGWHTDCAWSVLVGSQKEKEKFLKTGEEALWDGVAQAMEGNRVGNISSAIQTKVEGASFHVVRSLVGHGVGRKLHEPPEVPGYGEKNTGPPLREGMTLAIEVIYTKGTSDVILGTDGWTYLAADGSWAGLFEMTVVVGSPGRRPEILTGF